MNSGYDDLRTNEMMSSDDDMNAEDEHIVPATEHETTGQMKIKRLHNVPKVSGMNFSQLKSILSLKNRASINTNM
jgi:hypothetical protein